MLQSVDVMKDLGYAQVWDEAVATVRDEFAALPDRLLEQARVLSGNIKKQKAVLHDLTRSVNGEAACEICRGECCQSGKYHFTVPDLLAYLFEDKQLFVPDFANGHCPFLGKSGCFMEAEYRPFNCITFNCECIERLFRQSEVHKFYELENGLRTQYALMEKIFDNTFAYGLLANFERNGIGGGILFRREIPRRVSGG
jgi:hypothetical protein